MKLFMMFTVSILGIVSSNARASDLLFCHAGDTLNSRSLRVFSSSPESGYNFELYLSHKFAHEPPGPYAMGEVTRQGMTFKNENVSIVHLFGEYAYIDQRDGIDLRFPDSGCALADETDHAHAAVDLETPPIQAQALIGQGDYTTESTTLDGCDDPNAITGTIQAKANADSNAQNQCGTLQATHVGEYSLSYSSPYRHVFCYIHAKASYTCGS